MNLTEPQTIAGVTIKAETEGDGEARRIVRAEVLNPAGLTVGRVLSAAPEGSAWLWTVEDGTASGEAGGVYEAVDAVVNESKTLHSWQQDATPPQATAYTRRIYQLAQAAGLRPEWRAPYRGVARIALNAEGERGTFGAIQVGARSGRVLRAQLIHGGGGSIHDYEGATAVRRALVNLPH